MKIWFLSTLAIILLFTGASCTKERITQESSSLEFSTDTVIFDTVFTQVGTATRNFKVYNTSNKTLRISSIRLANPNSVFRINVDGLGAKSFTDVDVLPNDSLFVFVDAKIDPNGGNTPLIVTDSIIFNVNGVEKDIDLVAWGQDAIYYRADTVIAGLPPLKIIRKNETWTNIKPIVIYGYVVVDSLYTLTVQAGTKVYFHGSSGLWIFKDAQILVNGTKENPVVFQGDRLEPAYKDYPGQWDRIWINENTLGKNSVIEHAIIKNGLIGLQIETLPFDVKTLISPNTISIKNTIIQNHSVTGLYASNYKINAENVSVSNGGQGCIAITGSGEYNFKHVTAGDYFPSTGRKEPAFYMSNVYSYIQNNQRINSVREIKNSSFTNCIFYGNIEKEFDYALNTANGAAKNEFIFENCIVKRTETINDSRFVNLFYNSDPKFVSPSTFDLHIAAGSPAIDKGKTGLSVNTDLELNPRSTPPDLGAYEYVPK